jgi:hypothetical protein
MPHPLEEPRLTKATLLQLAVGAVVVLGLAAAARLRASVGSHEAPESSSASSAETPVAPGLGPTAPSAVPSRDLSPPGVEAVAAPPTQASDASLMAELRKTTNADPTRAIELAREGNRRFPDSPDAAERTSLLIHALAQDGRTSEARGAAEEMVNRYPDSAWVREIEQFTGAHRHRNLRLNADGGIESY